MDQSHISTVSGMDNVGQALRFWLPARWMKGGGSHCRGIAAAVVALTFPPEYGDRVVGLDRVGGWEMFDRRLPGGLVSWRPAGPGWAAFGQLHLLLAGLVRPDPLLELVLGNLALLAEVVELVPTRHRRSLKMVTAPVLE